MILSFSNPDNIFFYRLRELRIFSLVDLMAIQKVYRKSNPPEKAHS